MSYIRDSDAFEKAQRDIVDQVTDFVNGNKMLPEDDHYRKWLEEILSHLESLRRKDFF